MKFVEKHKKAIIVAFFFFIFSRLKNNTSMSKYSISQKGIDYIRKHEGLSLKAYYDVNGWAIGYGSHYYEDKSLVKQGDVITKEKAISMLKAHVQRSCIPCLNGLNLNQNQVDSLCSFIYNIGDGAFNKSTIKKLIKANPNDPNIATQFRRWNIAGGVVNNVLKKIREEEIKIYFNNQYPL